MPRRLSRPFVKLISPASGCLENEGLFAYLSFAGDNCNLTTSSEFSELSRPHSASQRWVFEKKNESEREREKKKWNKKPWSNRACSVLFARTNPEAHLKFCTGASKWEKFADVINDGAIRWVHFCFSCALKCTILWVHSDICLSCNWLCLIIAYEIRFVIKFFFFKLLQIVTSKWMDSNKALFSKAFETTFSAGGIVDSVILILLNQSQSLLCKINDAIIYFRSDLRPIGNDLNLQLMITEYQ